MPAHEPLPSRSEQMSALHLRARRRRPRRRQSTRRSPAPSVFVAFMTPCQNLLDEDLAGVLAQLLDIGERPVDLLLSTIRLGDDPCDSPAMPGDDDRLAALDLVKQPGQMGLRFRRLDFACHAAFQLVESTGHYCLRWSSSVNPFFASQSAASCAL